MDNCLGAIILVDNPTGWTDDWFNINYYNKSVMLDIMMSMVIDIIDK